LLAVVLVHERKKGGRLGRRLTHGVARKAIAVKQVQLIAFLILRAKVKERTIRRPKVLFQGCKGW